MLRKLIIVSVTLFALPAHADWTAKAEAGLVIATGNTETETGNAKAEVVNTTGNWKHKAGLAALYASDDGERTAERWEVYEQTDYNFSPRTFWFGAGRYEEDQFDGFEYQAILSTGIGRKFIDTDATKFVGTAGAGYKFYETRDAFDEETGALLELGDSDSEVVFRGTLDFDHKFNASTSFFNYLLVESGGDNTFVQDKIGIQVKMSEVLALAVGYAVRYNTDPPTGFEEMDTLTTVNLVYELK